MNTSNSQLDPNNLQFNSIRQANSEEIESSKQQYLTAKTILVEKLETVVRMLNAESAEQALSGEKRKEIREGEKTAKTIGRVGVRICEADRRS